MTMLVKCMCGYYGVTNANYQYACKACNKHKTMNHIDIIRYGEWNELAYDAIFNNRKVQREKAKNALKQNTKK